MLEKQCEICGKLFKTSRKDARFCSNACRIKNHRQVKIARSLFVEAPLPAVPKISIDEVAIIVQTAHNIAADLSSASLSTSGELSRKLERVSRGIDALLRGEGL